MRLGVGVIILKEVGNTSSKISSEALYGIFFVVTLVTLPWPVAFLRVDIFLTGIRTPRAVRM